jgi:DNA mismatch endonuclease (patch repair protein)
MDKFTSEKRSHIMAQVKGRDTKPEKLIRSIVHQLGFRFRLYRKDLPGKPDIVLPRHKKIIFVHGCFWHGHKDCSRSKRPTSNQEFWDRKIDGNIIRDRKNKKALKPLGWRAMVIWQCETRNVPKLIKRLEKFLVEE